MGAVLLLILLALIIGGAGLPDAAGNPPPVE